MATVIIGVIVGAFLTWRVYVMYKKHKDKKNGGGGCGCGCGG